LIDLRLHSITQNFPLMISHLMIGSRGLVIKVWRVVVFPLTNSMIRGWRSMIP